MNVCAAIVTYHPNLAELRVNLARLLPQVDAVVIVDNASHPSLREGIRLLAAEFHCDLIENPENLGIAAALNQAIAFAASRSAAFILFLDQDSGVSPEFVAQQLLALERASIKTRIGLVAPTVVQRASGKRSGPVPLRLGRHAGKLVLAQTSGALMPLTVFQDAGLFRADLFIDYVDYEHCLRMEQHGWGIVWSEAAELDHKPGNATPVRVLGRTILTVDASPSRHYYETRNCLWLVRHHLRSSPEMALRLLQRMVRVRFHALLFERNRGAKLSASLRGVFDALRGRLGPYRISK